MQIGPTYVFNPITGKGTFRAEFDARFKGTKEKKGWRKYNAFLLTSGDISL